MHTLLFVCTANQCRSPVAEAAMRHLLHQRTAFAPERDRLPGSSWIVRSAGAWASNGKPAYPAMRVAAAARGLDLSQHRSCSIDTIRPLSFFNLILTMEQSQKEALRAEFSPMAERIYTLGEMAGFYYDVADPIGKDASAFLLTVDEIIRLLCLGLEQIEAWMTKPQR